MDGSPGAARLSTLCALSRLTMLCAAGLPAAAMNAVVGGGSFVTCPALVCAGLPEVAANASLHRRVVPGTIASTWACRNDIVAVGDIGLHRMVPVTVAGGLCGATPLLVTPAHLFGLVISWLLLLTTLTFAFGVRAGEIPRRTVRLGPGAVFAIQFVIAAQGGYFGGAVGLMMLAAWGLPTASVNVKAMPRSAPCRSVPPTAQRCCCSSQPAGCAGHRRWPCSPGWWLAAVAAHG